MVGAGTKGQQQEQERNDVHSQGIEVRKVCEETQAPREGLVSEAERFVQDVLAEQQAQVSEAPSGSVEELVQRRKEILKEVRLRNAVRSVVLKGK